MLQGDQQEFKDLGRSPTLEKHQANSPQKTHGQGQSPAVTGKRLGDHAKLSSLRLPWRKPAGHWHAHTVHLLCTHSQCWCGTSTHRHFLHQTSPESSFLPSPRETAIPPRVTHCQPQNAIRLASNPGHTLRNAGFGFPHQITDSFLIGSLKDYKACGSPPIPWWRLLESPTLRSTNTEQVRRSV